MCSLPVFTLSSVRELIAATLYLLASRSVLNAAALLIAHVLCFSHISTYMDEHFHWLPLIAPILFTFSSLFTERSWVKPQHIFVTLYFGLSHLIHFVLSAIWIGLASLFIGLGLPWLRLVLLPALVPLHGRTSPCDSFYDGGLAPSIRCLKS